MSESSRPLTYPIAMWTAFNHMWNTFIIDRQPKCQANKQSDNPFPACSYVPKGGNTVGCMVGCLLPNYDIQKEYDEKIGGLFGNGYTSIHQLPHHEEIFAPSEVPEVFFFFLKRCQQVHDNIVGDPEPVWRLEVAKKLLAIGTAFGLSVVGKEHMIAELEREVDTGKVKRKEDTDQHTT